MKINLFKSLLAVSFLTLLLNTNLYAIKVNAEDIVIIRQALIYNLYQMPVNDKNLKPSQKASRQKAHNYYGSILLNKRKISLNSNIYQALFNYKKHIKKNYLTNPSFKEKADYTIDRINYILPTNYKAPRK